MSSLISGSSPLGNRRWVVVRAPSGKAWRIVTAYPFNLRSLPNRNSLNPGSVVLPWIIDVLMCVSGALSWRSVSVYNHVEDPNPGPGECYYLNRRVELPEVEAEVAQLVAKIEGGEQWLDSPPPGSNWAFVNVARLREDGACMAVCLACVAYTFGYSSVAVLRLVNVVATIWVMADIALVVAHQKSAKVPRPPAHMMLFPTLMAVLIAVLAFFLRLVGPVQT